MNFKWTISVSISTFIAVAAATCYDPTGNAQSNLVPCNPSAAVSMRCLAADYCLSNSLCFNGFGNNLLAKKGCTDPNWGSPCQNIWKDVGFAQALFPCANTEQDNGSISYLCGSDTTACSTSASLLSIPVGTIVLRPDQIAAFTSSSVSTSTSVSASTTQCTTESVTTTAPPSASKPNSLALGPGLGIGIPFGLALIGALVYFGRELQKYNNHRANIAQLTTTRPQLIQNSKASVTMVAGRPSSWKTARE